MKLTSGRLRRLIAEEVRNIMESDARDNSVEKAIFEFYKEAMQDENSFSRSFVRAQMIFGAYKVYQDFLGDVTPETQRSFTVREQLLRSYLRTLLESSGVDNDFRNELPNLNRLQTYMFGNTPPFIPGAQFKELDEKMKKDIFDSIQEYFGGYNEFIKVVAGAIEELDKMTFISGQVEEAQRDDEVAENAVANQVLLPARYSEKAYKGARQLSNAFVNLCKKIPSQYHVNARPVSLPTLDDIRKGPWRRSIPKGREPDVVPELLATSCTNTVA